MDTTCYRGLPKFIGAFIDVLYQNPTLQFAIMAGIIGLAGLWWFKRHGSTE